jgi:hypothetical protein
MSIEFTIWVSMMAGIILSIILYGAFTFRLIRYNQKFYQKHKESIKAGWFMLPVFFSKGELKELDLITKRIWVINRWIGIALIALLIYWVYRTWAP